MTETDLLGIASSNLLPHHAAQDRDLQERIRVRDIMVRDVVTVPPDLPVQQTARLLLKQRFVTSSDFTKLIAEAERERSKPGSGEPQRLL